MQRYLGILLALVLLCGCSQSKDNLSVNDGTLVQTMAMEQTSQKTLGDDVPITRGQVAKMLAMAFFNLDYINNQKRQITFSDTSVEKWYDKYINTVYLSGKMNGGDNLFRPDDTITLEQAQILLDKLNPNNKLKLQMTEETKNYPISYALWVQFYKTLLESLSEGKTIEEKFGITEMNFVVLATPGNNGQLTGWNMITDIGPLSFVGFNMDKYIDKEIRVLIKDDDVLAVLAIESTRPTIKNAFLVQSNKDSVTVFSGGAERTYKGDASEIKSALVDITIDNGLATKIEEKTQFFNDKILQVNPTEIVFESKGGLKLSNGFKIYSTLEPQVMWRQRADLVLGSNCANFYTNNDVIEAAVITIKPLPKNIRVAISTTNFTSLIHSNVALSGTTSFIVKAGETEQTFEPWDDVQITSENFNNADRIYVKPVSADGKIIIESIKRNWSDNASPKYRGFLEISQMNGGFVIVNELGFEEYLYAVVPSEIPSGYGVEPSQVQAITARSYAYNQYYSNRFSAYGANVDDSVSSQVYNNIPENETSIKAVDSTKGECLTFNKVVISANFFSNSAGMTANSGQVWVNPLTKQFPTLTPEYLQAVPQYLDGDYGDLSLEENARKFFKDMNVVAYDSDFNWFRWNVNMTAEEIGASINANLKTRYEANPTLIKVVSPDGSSASTPIDSIGTLVDIEVISRGEGGNIMQMKITGSKATILVSTEYNIRFLIRPYQYTSNSRAIITNLKDGTKLSNYSIMPSGFFVIDKTNDAQGKLSSITFYGGGNGHGVGMSQNGVKGMSDRGFTVSKILEHFYPGTEIIKVL